MTFFSILETLLIGPLKLVFEIIFSYANSFIGHPGLAIIVLSLIMNILVLPLYKRADIMQEETRDIEAKLQDGVAHIKKTFTGDERMMILQTYYKQNNYKPTDALNGSVSLLLEIPFFMAAYQFLSHLDILNGVSLGPIKDLGAPDGLIVIGGVAINLLPVLMTLINVISSYLYLKGYPLKTKIQLYAMALFFLVFLYTSPACLVFYWTLNNLFSLVKTIFYKLKNPRKILNIITSLVGLAFFVFGFIYDTDSIKRKVFLFGVGVLLQLPILLPLLKSKIKVKSDSAVPEPSKKIFFMGSLFLTLLVGVLIPSNYIAASPQEYVDVTYFHNPLWYVVSAFCLSAGLFLVWMGVFYWLASPKGKVVFNRLVWILCGVMFVNYMFFGTNLGVISSTLQYEKGMAFSVVEQLINIGVIALIAAILYFCIKKWKKAVPTILLIAIIAVGGMSGMNMVTVKKSIDKISSDAVDIPTLNLSKTGQNVIVLMLDRAIGSYIPYILNEKPELKEKFDGFTYYNNVISFGGFTNFGTPALFGGYEYTPIEMNKRDSESLATKQNEALKVMPKVFAENGYDVTVCDPVYANYQWLADLSIYDDIPEIKTYISKGQFGEADQKERAIQNNYRNFFCFSFMKTMPLVTQTSIYNNGKYNQVATDNSGTIYSTQVTDGISVSEGISSIFMESYNTMTSLSKITKITEEEKNTFLVMSNDATHDPILLKEPEYVPAEYVDNTEFDEANKDRFTLNGVELKIEYPNHMSFYQTNMAIYIQLGKWFDYLRENGVYDNTRIILVSDHGQKHNQIDELMVEDDEGQIHDVQAYFPLLMVKDFNSEGFTVSDSFMTNADVPTLATEGLVKDPKNPFTGKSINSEEKTLHDQYIITSEMWNVVQNNGNTFLPSGWAKVKNNIWDKENWTFYNEETVKKEYK